MRPDDPQVRPLFRVAAALIAAGAGFICLTLVTFIWDVGFEHTSSYFIEMTVLSGTLATLFGFFAMAGRGPKWLFGPRSKPSA